MAPRFRIKQRVDVIDAEGDTICTVHVEAVGRQVVTGIRRGPFLMLHYWHCRGGRGVGAWRDYRITETKAFRLHGRR